MRINQYSLQKSKGFGNAFKKFKILFFLLAVFTFAAQETKAQAGGKKAAPATISKDMLITLDASAPLATQYVFDISGLGFTNQEEATSFFNRYRDNLVAFTVDYPSKKVTVELHTKYAPASWSLAEWNGHFKKKASNYQAIK
ncbi:hypothetical protein ACD591_16740 [Rufibacter glacialis]|uniref:Uncharacterized protein n=1 Tax=Rufibacter glacialis TaxID=1259555 RepID=A0A5M8QSE1_9BACT|nr:hypothetical protein [Rufibacter glacialis]KAA6437413.1 hypothetical protein FOE74_02620 [Rufibacter glacialis]GGK59448.1 hypothetical protein GCM10011405_04520 [Rufibacter glacialis]